MHGSQNQQNGILGKRQMAEGEAKTGGEIIGQEVPGIGGIGGLY